MIEIKLPDLSRVVLRPGDVLLVRADRPISEKDAHAIRERLRVHFPDNDAVILGVGVDLVVIRPADGERIEAMPPPAWIGVRFKEVNDRPDHMGPA